MHQIVTIKLDIDFTEDLHQDVKLRRTYEFRPANVWDVLDLMGKLHETLVHEIEDAQDKVEFLEKLDHKVSTTEAVIDNDVQGTDGAGAGAGDLPVGTGDTV